MHSQPRGVGSVDVVERAFCLLRRATRYDKHAIIDRGGVVLAATLTWLRLPVSLPDAAE